MGSVEVIVLDTLWRLQRVQRIQEQNARLEVVRSEAQLDSSEARLAGVLDAISTARTNAEGLGADDVARVHAYTLRMEMQRRRQAAEVERSRRALEERRSSLVEASLTRRTTELAAESAEAVRDALARTREQARLDEIGLIAYARRTS